MEYRYEISFLGDFKDRELIADEITRVFENFMHKKHLIKGDIKLEVKPKETGGMFMKLLDIKTKKS